MVYVTLSLVDSLQASTFMRPCSHLRQRDVQHEHYLIMQKRQREQR